MSRLFSEEEIYEKFRPYVSSNDLDDIMEEMTETKTVVIPDDANNGDIVEKFFGKDTLWTLASMMYVPCCKKLDKWRKAPYKTEKWVNFAEELKDVFEDEVEE